MSTSRSLWIGLSFPGLVAFAPVAAAYRQHADAAHVVLVIWDDPNPLHLGLQLDCDSMTPELDELVAGGVTFRNVQTMPRCAPSVARIASGKECLDCENFVFWNGVQVPPADTTLLAQVMRCGGYLTFGQGKGTGIGIPDYDSGFQFGKNDPGAFWRVNVATGVEAPTITPEMKQFLRACCPDACPLPQPPTPDCPSPVNWTTPIPCPPGGMDCPRFIWLMPTMPHTPWNAPSRFDLTTDQRNQLPQAYVDDEADQIEMTRYMDERLGKLRAKLEVDVVPNTDRDVWLVNVFGDNGYANGFVHKGSPYEKGVGCVVNFYNLTLGAEMTPAEYDLPVSTLDVPMTILGLGHITPPVSYDGESLLGLIVEPSDGRIDEATWIGQTGRDTVHGAAFSASPLDPDQGSGQPWPLPLPPPEDDVFALYAHHRDGAGGRWKYIIWLTDVYEPDPDLPVQPLPNTTTLTIHHDYASFGFRARFQEELYDLSVDPGEQTDLAAAPEHATLVDDLRLACFDWWDSYCPDPSCAEGCLSLERP